MPFKPYHTVLKGLHLYFHESHREVVIGRTEVSHQALQTGNCQWKGSSNCIIEMNGRKMSSQRQRSSTQGPSGGRALWGTSYY